MTGTALAAANRALRLRPSREVALPALIFLAFALLPLFASLTAKQYLLDLAASVIVFAVAAVALDLLVGYAGLISLGHARSSGLAPMLWDFYPPRVSMTRSSRCRSRSRCRCCSPG